MNNFIRPGLGRASYIWGHAGFQKYFKNTGWMFLGRIFAMTIGFLISIYIARYLGPSNYGLFNYTISFVALFGFIANLGLGSILNRELIKDHNKKDELLGTTFYIKIVAAILAIIAVISVSFFTASDKLTLILIALFSFNFIPSTFDILGSYFNSQVLAKKVVIPNVIAVIISAGLKLLLIHFDKGIFWLTIIYLVESLIVISLLIFNYKKIGNQLSKWKFDFKIAKSLLKDSWPLMLMTATIGIYMKIDQVMIKNILGNEQVGLYAVAVKLSEAWYFIPGVITASLFPAIINAHKKSAEDFDGKMSKLYFFMFWGSFLFALFVTFLASPIISILFGQEYLGAIVVLQIYVWSAIIISMKRVIGRYLLTKNFTKIMFYSNLIGLIFNLILNIILIKHYGIAGAAVATIVSYSSTLFVLFFINKTRSHAILMLKSILKFK